MQMCDLTPITSSPLQSCVARESNKQNEQQRRAQLQEELDTTKTRYEQQVQPPNPQFLLCSLRLALIVVLVMALAVVVPGSRLRIISKPCSWLPCPSTW